MLPTGFDPKVSVHLLDQVKVYKNPEGEALKVKYVFSGRWCLSTGCWTTSPRPLEKPGNAMELQYSALFGASQMLNGHAHGEFYSAPKK